VLIAARRLKSDYLNTDAPGSLRKSQHKSGSLVSKPAIICKPPFLPSQRFSREPDSSLHRTGSTKLQRHTSLARQVRVRTLPRCFSSTSSASGPTSFKQASCTWRLGYRGSRRSGAQVQALERNHTSTNATCANSHWSKWSSNATLNSFFPALRA